MKTILSLGYYVLALLFFVWIIKPDKSDAGEEPIARYGMIEFTTGELAGLRVGKLYQLYLGLETDVVPATLLTDFDAQLEKLWQLKAEVSGLKNVAEETRWQLIREYSQHRSPTSLIRYRQTIDQISDRLYLSLNWEKMCRERGMKQRNCKLLQEISATIGGKEILAYGLTELMPALNGNLNVQILDLILKHAGREYVESLPAVYDSYTSFGLYQFTQYAVFDIPGEARGASIVNRYLPLGEQIPGSVSMLRGDDHHKAAWLFAVRNLMRMIHRLNIQQLVTLENGRQSRDDEIVQYIAVAHHTPSGAITIAKRWIDNYLRYDFSVSVNSRYLAYAKKTKSNYQALSSF